jgi:phosphoribosylformylglycinamidine cyclo-ligase
LSGLHTNGYSLARQLFLETAGYSVDTHVDDLKETVGAALLRPHLSYLSVLKDLLDRGIIKGLAHITGGGLLENIPRILPENMGAQIERGSWPALPLFEVLQRLGNIDEAEMFRTFNMGLGMIIVCAPENANAIRSHVELSNGECYRIGSTVPGSREVIIK